MDPALIQAKDVFLKRNTDCIYFLASPLTCKKGTKCEFRHSESARFNLKDCYYWLNGNCLNPKCAFRHPPLDGLLGHASIPSQPPTSNKQSSLCIYFQRGNCLKADKCPFTHVAQQSIPRNTAKASPSIFENQEALNKESSNMKQCDATQHNVSKAINGFSHLKNLLPKSSQKHQTRANVQPSVKEMKNVLGPGEIADHCYYKLGAHFSNNLNGQFHNDYKMRATAYYEENHVERKGKVHGYHERKPQRREVERSVDDMCLSDLRQRLKQRKLDCSDTASARYRVSREVSRRNRLNGRISVPGKERGFSRNRGRLSPTRRYGKEPPFPANSRNVRSRLSKKDAADYVNFSGPKSLAELKEEKKKKKEVESAQVEIRKEDNHEETVGPCPTSEGLKPLSVLLKRKRGEHEIDRINGEEEGEDKVDDNVPEKGDTFVATQNNAENNEVETLVKEHELEEEEEEGDIMDIDGVEDGHLENLEGGYELNGDGNGEEEDEDEEFARKIGLVFS